MLQARSLVRNAVTLLLVFACDGKACEAHCAGWSSATISAAVFPADVDLAANDPSPVTGVAERDGPSDSRAGPLSRRPHRHSPPRRSRVSIGIRVAPFPLSTCSLAGEASTRRGTRPPTGRHQAGRP